MITELTSSYLEMIRQKKATAEIEAGTIVISDVERLIPIGPCCYRLEIRLPESVMRQKVIPILYRKEK